MNITFGTSTNDRYSAKNMAKPVNFYCSAPTAQSVCLVGDFNGWNSLANPMRRQADGCCLPRCSFHMVITDIAFWWMANRLSTPAVLVLLAMSETSGCLSSR
jgi:hypothetical protein